MSDNNEVSQKERKELYNKIRELTSFISKECISPQAIVVNMKLTPYKVKNKFYNITSVHDIPSTKKNFENLKRLVSVMEEMKELASDDLEICRYFRNGDYHKLEHTVFYVLYKRLSKEFPEDNQDQIVEQAKEKLRLKFDFLEDAFSRGFLNFADTFLPEEDIFRVLNGHIFLENQRDIRDLEIACSEYTDTLKHGLHFDIDDEEGEPMGEVDIPPSAEEAEEYRLLMEEKLEALRLQAKEDPATQDEIEAAKRAERMYYLFHGRYDTHYFSESKKSNIDSLNRKKLQKDMCYKLTDDQQKAVLEVYLDKCFDENGFLLPDHFGSGIYLMNIGVGKTILPFDRIVKKFEFNPKNEYKRDDPIPITDTTDPLYRFIDEHKNVLIGNRYTKQINEVRQILDDAGEDVSNDVFMKLMPGFHWEHINSELSGEYYKMVSEYNDLISIKEPTGKNDDHSLACIYRIVYELCLGSDGKYSFSIDSVFNTERALMYSGKDWIQEMYIYSCCFRNKSARQLISYIQKHRSKERPLEME